MSNVSHQQLLPYQVSWPVKFAAEKERLTEVFGSQGLEIEHIGSTAVPGLAAKPIVDIAVMVETCQIADAFIEPLRELGYTPYPPSSERHFYTQGDPLEYHLSVAYANTGGFWPRQILFRDYLRSHSWAREEYADIKRNLLSQDPTGYDTYIDAKGEFVYRILKRAGWREDLTYWEWKGGTTAPPGF